MSSITFTLVSRRALLGDAVRECLSTSFEWLPTADGCDVLVIDGYHLRQHIPAIKDAVARKTKCLLLSAADGDYQIAVATALGVRGFVHEREGLPALSQAVLATRTRGSYVSPGMTRSRLTPQITAMLTPRQLQVFEAAVEGIPDAQTADLLGLSAATVEWHRTAAMKKLNVHDWTSLVVLGLRVGAVALDEVNVARPERRSARR